MRPPAGVSGPEIAQSRRAGRRPVRFGRLWREISVCSAIFFIWVGAPAPVGAAEIVAFESRYPNGTILVRTSERRLYLLLDGDRAIRYTVGVGKSGKTWSGAAYIRSKHIRPAWSPPAEIKRDNPRLPAVIPGGSPSNPMGAAALTLSRGQYAIHGTNRPNSIGGYVSYGCIRMYNEDILDLYARVDVGTAVVVTR